MPQLQRPGVWDAGTGVLAPEGIQVKAPIANIAGRELARAQLHNCNRIVRQTAEGDREPLTKLRRLESNQLPPD